MPSLLLFLVVEFFVKTAINRNEFFTGVSKTACLCTDLNVANETLSLKWVVDHLPEVVHRDRMPKTVAKMLFMDRCCWDCGDPPPNTTDE